MNDFNKLNCSVNNFNIEKNLVTVKDTEQPPRKPITPLFFLILSKSILIHYYPSKNLLVSYIFSFFSLNRIKFYKSLILINYYPLLKI